MKPLIIVSMLIAAIGASIWYYTQPDPITVKLHTVDAGTVKSTVSNTRVGTIKACRRAYLAPATGGQVAKLAVKEGSQVRQGQLLMAVWNKDLQAQIDLAQADAVASRARANQACAIAARQARSKAIAEATQA